MSQPLVAVDVGPVSVVRLDNPPLNLVTKELTRQLGDVLSKLEQDRRLRAVVVTGGERAFCAGSDIGEFASLQGRVAEDKLLLEGAVYRRLARLSVPTIAAIEGAALGGGLELALCCDMRVAGDTARLGLPEVSLGAIPGSGGTQRLPRLIGRGQAKEMILLGEPIEANRAAEIGLIERVVPAGRAEAEASEMAAVIASRGPLAVREAKAAIDEGLEMPLDAGLTRELDASERVFSSRDLQEGAEAFREKRPPEFEGR
jgi:enoyl-CoA hydratase